MKLPAAPLCYKLFVAAAALFSFIAAFVHPIGDAPDEYEHMQVIAHIAQHGTLPLPSDRLVQGVHPPLSFAPMALLVRPLDAVARLLPERLTIPWPYKIEIPLSAPGQFIMTAGAEGHLDCPGGYRAATLYALRAFAAFLTILGLALALRAASVLVPGRPLAVAGAASALLWTPMTVVQFGTIASEPIMLIFCAWAALELAKGVRRDLEYSPVRLGLAIGGAALTRHSGTLLIEAAVLVAIFRWAWHGRARAAKELAIVCLIGLSGIAVWMARNYVQTGDATLVQSNLEWQPQLFRPLPPGWNDYDQFLYTIVTTWFGAGIPGIGTPSAFLFIYLFLTSALAMAGSADAFAGRRGVAPAGRATFFLALTGAHVAMTPAWLANSVAPHNHGRYLLTGIPLLLPLLAAGLARLFDGGKLKFIAAAILCFSGTACFTSIFFILIPTFSPRAARVDGAIAYADCGAHFDHGRIRGGSMNAPGSVPFPSALTTLAADPERVEYEFSIPPSASTLTFTAALLGGSVGGEVRLSGPGALPPFAFPMVNVRAGGERIAWHMAPLPGVQRYEFPVPARAIQSGKLRLAFEAAGGLPAVGVAEIRVQEGHDPLAPPQAPFTRSCAAGSTGIGTTIVAFDSRSRFVRRLQRADSGVVCATGEVALPPGHYRCRVRVRAVESSAQGTATLRVQGPGGATLAERAIAFESPRALEWRTEELSFHVDGESSLPVNARLQSNGYVSFDTDDLEILRSEAH